MQTISIGRAPIFNGFPTKPNPPAFGLPYLLSQCRPELAAGGMNVFTLAVPDHGYAPVIQQEVPE
jgi:hypothetical protein